MTTSDYRNRAKECVEFAQNARTREQRTMLLHIAETWLRLAEDTLGRVNAEPLVLSNIDGEPTPTLN
jgi:hypothetical protein